jgi:hypothetical protein
VGDCPELLYSRVSAPGPGMGLMSSPYEAPAAGREINVVTSFSRRSARTRSFG